ncbi:hypothetical protein M2132_000683 [Dysgonomonas sp. PH5-45]|uniref:DUF5074 domain-containing protein n=1 Tax=unclassified Dysgonomonas TaxID=2630389 RepID=UPI002472F78F|nr:MULTISPECIES: DUF5074 domain-containing protein [unclassified Dysgonomonas]MDH6354355.1 hypothetical protein [Dysgonomonas sp. PH5-45]MDH6387255.1 hypothetical protein [Dysgonomonas sp. PH5-37]
MNKIFTLLMFLLVSAGAFCTGSGDAEYKNGVFIVNEDWYGHQNSAVNFLSDDGQWTYRVIQKENEGMELGSTSQFGAIHDGKFYIVSKQEKDPGAAIVGGRLTVCNAVTMKILKQFPVISKNEEGKSNADGRAFVGIDEHKGYISTNNGIYVFDIDNLEIGAQIEGSANPEGSGYGSLYRGQVGNMIKAGNYVFAIHQSLGVLVIDIKEDKIIKTIQAPLEFDETKEKEIQRGFGSIVQSKDQSLWISVCFDQIGSGNALDRLYKLDPETMDTLRVELPKGWSVPSSWYAWTADGFCASTKENRIYWKNNGGWFASTKIYCYDIDTQVFSEVYDTSKIGWNIYGAGFRIHPVTDEIYCSLFHEFLEPTYQTVRISTEGELLNEYSMINNYWFPAIPVFPEVEKGGNSLINETGSQEVRVYPNPCVEYMYVETEIGTTIALYNLSGQNVYEAISSGEKELIHTAELPKGTYILKAGGKAAKIIKH